MVGATGASRRGVVLNEGAVDDTGRHVLYPIRTHSRSLPINIGNPNAAIDRRCLRPGTRIQVLGERLFLPSLCPRDGRLESSEPHRVRFPDRECIAAHQGRAHLIEAKQDVHEVYIDVVNPVSVNGRGPIFPAR